MSTQITSSVPTTDTDREERQIAPLLVTPEQAPAPHEVTSLELAERIQPLLGCLDRFCGEVVEQLADMDRAFDDESRTRLRRRLDTARQVLHWTDGVIEDIRQEAHGAAAGLHRTSCRRIVADLLVPMVERRPGLAFQWGSDDEGMLWSRPDDLVDLFRLGLDLTAQRIGGEGVLRIEIGSSDGFIHVRLLGIGESRPLVAPGQVSRLRQLMERVGGAILPDVLGGGGSGMTLRLPISDTGSDIAKA